MRDERHFAQVRDEPKSPYHARIRVQGGEARREFEMSLRSRLLTGLLFIALIAVYGVAQNPITLVSSSDTHGTLSEYQLNSCLRQLAREWDIDAKSLPHIVFFHVSHRTANAAFISKDVAVRKNFGASDSEVYYEVWVVGPWNTQSAVLGLENVLESHFALTMTEAKRKTVMAKVLSLQDSLDVSAGQ